MSSYCHPMISQLKTLILWEIDGDAIGYTTLKLNSMNRTCRQYWLFGDCSVHGLSLEERHKYVPEFCALGRSMLCFLHLANTNSIVSCCYAMCGLIASPSMRLTFVRLFVCWFVCLFCFALLCLPCLALSCLVLSCLVLSCCVLVCFVLFVFSFFFLSMDLCC